MDNISRRLFLTSLPILAAAPRLTAGGLRLQSSPASAPFRSTGLSQLTLTVSDVKRSVDFYQGLLGMPIQAPVFGTDGDVVMMLALSGFAQPLSAAATKRHARRLLAATAHVTDAIHGSFPTTYAAHA